MRYAALVFLLLVCQTGFGFRYDAAHSVLLHASITGSIEADLDVSAALIREQLLYFVGPLNGYNAGADIGNAKITLIAATEGRPNSKVGYEAEFLVAWPRGVTVPGTFRNTIPVKADAAGKKKFFDAYGARCQSGEEPADAGSFFYYYRPEKQGCSILQSFDSRIAMLAKLTLTAHSGATTGKSPEYQKIWEDGRFVMTLVVGTYKDGSTSPSDVGIQNYNQVYKSLRAYFGNPTSINVPLGPQSNPGAQYPDVEMTFQPDGAREVNINLLLIQKSQLQHPSPTFLARIQQRTEMSDVFTYNGHSGLGANIRALAKIGKYTEGLYQIFFVNGCDTLTYVDGTLAAAHGAVNPGYEPSKHLDLITNAMPSQFSDFTQNAMALSRAIWESKATYRQILAGFASFQKAIVSGEEDNS